MTATIHRTSQESWQLAAQLARRLSQSAARHIPAEEMLDYAYGGLDDEHLRALYGQHLDACALCQDAQDLYRAQRPVDPARITEVPEFRTQQVDTETYELTRESAGSRLREFVERGEGPLVIVAGEANPAVYDDRLAEALRKRAASARRAGYGVPRIICGPAIGLNLDISSPEKAVLPRLAESGDVHLFISTHRQSLHFRVSGDDAVYTEEYHRAGDGGTRRGFWYQSRPIANLFYRRFEATLRAGLASPATADAFIYLPMDRIRAIEEVAGDFDSMTAEELAAAA